MKFDVLQVSTGVRSQKGTAIGGRSLVAVKDRYLAEGIIETQGFQHLEADDPSI